MTRAMLDTPALKFYALASTILSLQLIALALWTGTVRVRNKKWVNPEDAKFNKGDETEADHPAVQRVKRAHLNALENAVPFFIVGLLYAMTVPPKDGALLYFGTFTAARLLHSLFYLWGKQPFRTLMFALGVLCVIGMSTRIFRVAM